MDNKEKQLFGQHGGAEQILAAAKERVQGQTMSKEQREKAERLRTEQATTVDISTAASFTEEIVRYLNQVCNDRDFTPEQRVFSVALATINLRESIPEKFLDGTMGGKGMFDRVCAAAREYYDKHANES